jgi:hypothetical protein
MTSRRTPGTLLPWLTAHSTLLLVPLVVVILLLAAIPTPRSDPERRNPTRDAEAFRQSLQERIREPIPGLEALAGAPADSTGGAPLTRNLFARGTAPRSTAPYLMPRQDTSTIVPQRTHSGEPLPAEERPPGSQFLDANAFTPEPAAPSAGSGLPELSAILIDGPWRQAVIAGRAVAEGETVEGYRVLEITSRSVRISKGKAVHELQLGETP